MKPFMRLDTSGLRRTLERKAREWDPQIGAVLTLVGKRTVDLLRSYTGKRNKRGRTVHPGGWGDKTFTLRDSFFYEVVHERPGVWALVIGNTARHAHLVEAVDGIFVVRGIAEPGGPVDVALRQAVHEISPEWEVE